MLVVSHVNRHVAELILPAVTIGFSHAHRFAAALLTVIAADPSWAVVSSSTFSVLTAAS